MFGEIRDIKSTKDKLREFGLTIGIILVILGVAALWRSSRGGLNIRYYPYFLEVGALFIILGLTFPRILKPFQKIWMGLAIIIGFFVSRIILTILFYGVLAPIGLVTRLLGKDILDQRIDKTCQSYWHDRGAEIKDKRSYENQF